MRITILAAGSRGDVQPSAVLAYELLNRGHSVVLGVADDLTHFGDRLGIPTIPLGFRARDFLESEEGLAWLAAGDARKYTTGLLSYKMARADVLQKSMLEASSGSDIVVSGVLSMDEAACIAEAKGVPIVGIHHAPRRPNPYFPSFTLTSRRLPKVANTLSYHVVSRVEWHATARFINQFRIRLGLNTTSRPVASRMRSRSALELQMYSRFLVPELELWSPRRPLVGFIGPTAQQRKQWQTAESNQPLDAWLAAGPPPVFFGFGSMPIRDPKAMIALIKRVSTRLGVRALIGAGWSDYVLREGGAPDEQIRIEKEMDHSTVFAKCRVAVHHGGAGTTAASIAAGVPTLICAVSFDQPFWGQRVADLGIGAWIPFAKVSETSLVSAIRSLLNPQVAARAREIGSYLEKEPAAATAASYIEREIDKVV